MNSPSSLSEAEESLSEGTSEESDSTSDTRPESPIPSAVAISFPFQSFAFPRGSFRFQISEK